MLLTIDYTAGKECAMPAQFGYLYEKPKDCEYAVGTSSKMNVDKTLL